MLIRLFDPIVSGVCGVNLSRQARARDRFTIPKRATSLYLLNGRLKRALAVHPPQKKPQETLHSLKTIGMLAHVFLGCQL